MENTDSLDKHIFHDSPLFNLLLLLMFNLPASSTPTGLYRNLLERTAFPTVTSDRSNKPMFTSLLGGFLSTVTDNKIDG